MPIVTSQPSLMHTLTGSGWKLFNTAVLLTTPARHQNSSSFREGRNLPWAPFGDGRNLPWGGVTRRKANSGTDRGRKTGAFGVTDELTPSFSAAESDGMCVVKARPKRPRRRFKQLCLKLP